MLTGSSITPEAGAQWRQRTLALLNDVFGPDSPQVRDFSRIRFDDSPVIDAAERLLRMKAAEEGADIAGVKISLPPAEAALRRGLHEAAEFLRSLVI